MRVIYCVTLSFLLIFHAFQRVPTSSASPLPLPGVHRGELLPSNPQDLLVGEDTDCFECCPATASIASVNSELLDPYRLPAASDRISSGSNELDTAFDLEEYPYPTTTKTPKQSRTKSSRHSSTRSGAPASTSVAPGTLFVTTSYAPASSPSVKHGTLSPLRPLYDAGKTPIIPASSQAQPSALPWVLGFFIPTTLGISICFGIRHRNRKKAQKAISHPIVPSDSYSSATSDMATAVSTEKTGLGIRFEGPYNTSTVPTLPPINVQPMGMEANAPTIQNDGRQIQDMLDRFELKAAVFPTRGELGHYVFPGTAAAVEREIQAGKRVDSEQMTQTALFPTSSSNPRDLMSSRPAFLSSKRIAPKPFGSRIQTAQRKRFSPIGEVLYSTGADKPLETVHEESNAKDLDVLRTPMAAYKGGEGEFSSGPENEGTPLASSTSYGVSSSPVGLRARRRSSPLIPEVVFSEAPWTPTMATEYTGVVAPLRLNNVKRYSPNHRRSATKSEIFGSTNVLGNLLVTGASDADEEERKFTEFVKGLVWNAHARDRQSRRDQASVSSAIDLGMTAVKPDDLSHLERPMLLPAPSFGAALSDFGISSSTLASEVPSSSSRFSIGVAL